MASVLELAVAEAGLLRGARAAQIVVSWAIAEQQLGHELGAAEGGHLSAAVREYAAYWKQSERTSWRELARFKAAFPREESPARLAAAVLQAADDRRLDRASAATLSLVV